MSCWIIAAGNDGKNTDITDNFPNKPFVDSLGVNMGKADAWIEVGASGWKNDESLLAEFCEITERSRLMFSLPAWKINSTFPNSTYKEVDGTSMASPVVSGLAALIWSYYPGLTAVQVKEAIMKSVTKIETKVKVKDETGSKKVPFSEVSVSGGVVNAYNAIQLAQKMNVPAATAGAKSRCKDAICILEQKSRLLMSGFSVKYFYIIYNKSLPCPFLELLYKLIELRLNNKSTIWLIGMLVEIILISVLLRKTVKPVISQL